MLKITKQGNSLIVEGVKNGTYPNNGVNEYPLNSLIAVTDESDMVTFRSAATNDVLFSGKVEDITINGESVTKDNILTKFDAVSNAATGGGGGGGSVDAYTKAESDAKYATKEYAEEIAFNSGNDIKEEIGTYVSEISDYVDNGKINYTVKNIADGYSEPRGIPFKTINGQNVLGEGNIEIQGGGDVDLSNYPTKQEVNQTYLQKEGEYVKAVTTNGGAINFEKGNGTPDVVNFKTIGGQSIIGMDDIGNATTSKSGLMSADDKKKLNATAKVYMCSQGEYDSMSTYDNNTLYLIIEQPEYL